MIVNRTMVRLSAWAALSNHFRAPFPTIAGENIHDSKIDPVETTPGETMYPLVVVYTDYDLNGIMHRWSRSEERVLTLTFEIFVGQITDSERDGNPAGLYIPETDAEIEVNLDILEDQIYLALNNGTPAANCFQALCHKMSKIISRRGASVEGGTKLAARQITMEMSVPQGPVFGNLPEGVDEFLTDMESAGIYSDLPAELRQYFLRGNDISLNERTWQCGGLNDVMRNALGLAPDATKVLPPTVRWLGPDGVPL